MKTRYLFFLDRKVKLQPIQAAITTFRMRNLNSLSDSKQVCLVPNPKSKLGTFRPELFSNTKRYVCQCVVEQTGHHGYNPASKPTMRRHKNLRRYNVKECPNHADKDQNLKRIDEFKSINNLFSMKSETNDGL